MKWSITQWSIDTLRVCLPSKIYCSLWNMIFFLTHFVHKFLWRLINLNDDERLRYCFALSLYPITSVCVPLYLFAHVIFRTSLCSFWCISLQSPTDRFTIKKTIYLKNYDKSYIMLLNITEFFFLPILYMTYETSSNIPLQTSSSMEKNI